MKTIDILGEDQYKVLITNLSLYFNLSDNEIECIKESLIDAVKFIRSSIFKINEITAEIKKALNNGDPVKLEELNNLFNSKRELLRIKDALDGAIDSMRTQAMDLINQIEQLS